MHSRLFVVSDLHLAGAGPLNNFHAGHELAALIRQIAAPEEVVLEGERVYLNTGTWTDLMKLPPLEDDSAVQAFIDQLEAGELQRLRRLSYAEVTADGPRLHFWGDQRSQR